MKDRISISQEYISQGKFSKDKRYYNTRKELRVYYEEELSSLEIDLLVMGNLTFWNCPLLKSISEKIILNTTNQSYLEISFCPKLKTLPNNLIFNKTLFLPYNQHLTTILSKEQFYSLEKLVISGNLISSYEEYFSLIEPTLIKNNLLKVCTL